MTPRLPIGLGRRKTEYSGGILSGLFDVPSPIGAEYAPLPNFTVPSRHVERVRDPSLASVSTQLGRVLERVSLLNKTLKEQLELQRYNYKEDARLQREINAEALRADNDNDLSSISGMDPLLAALAGLTQAIEERGSGDGNSGSGWGGMIGGALGLAAGALVGKKFFGIGGKTPDVEAKASYPNEDKLKPHQFVSKAEAFDKDGKLKPGYEAVESKTGRIVGYKRSIAVAEEGILSRVGKFAKGAVESVGKGSMTGAAFKIIGKVAVPIVVLKEAYDAWREIEAIPQEASTEVKRSETAKILGRFVGRYGLTMAGFALGSTAGSVVGGVGAIPGAVLGVAGAVALEYAAGDSTDKFVNAVVDTIYPVDDSADRPSADRSGVVQSSPVTRMTNTSQGGSSTSSSGAIPVSTSQEPSIEGSTPTTPNETDPVVPDATPVMEPSTPNLGSEVDKTSMEVSHAESIPPVPTQVVENKTGQRVPPVLPSTTAGYTGTGFVPDPTFSLGEVAKQLFYHAEVW